MNIFDEVEKLQKELEALPDKSIENVVGHTLGFMMTKITALELRVKALEEHNARS